MNFVTLLTGCSSGIRLVVGREVEKTQLCLQTMEVCFVLPEPLHPLYIYSRDVTNNRFESENGF